MPRICVITILAALVCTVACAAEDILIQDFEGADFGNWKTEGDAFGSGPAKGTLPHQMEVSGFLGKGLASSFHGGDDSVGTLTSPAFKVERKFVNFLIGGGGYAGETCMNLLVDGKAVRTATGTNVVPGGSERLAWQSWDVGDLAGKEATIQIVDKRKGGWGHISVDNIVQSDKKREDEQPKPATREIAIEKAYLHFPVKNGAPKRRVKVAVGRASLPADEKIIDEFEIELAEDQADFWVFLHVEPYKGKTATISGMLPPESKALAAVVQSDEVPDAANLYKETKRPQIHFSARRGWLNDPNGLVYYKGEYHLYFQANPYGWKWDNMHWGHAVSPDLVHWQEVQMGIYPFKFGDWAFSGSAIVDKDNLAGFKKGNEDVIVAAYTSTGRGECIVYSNDRGRTFTEYEGNPVVKHSGRDPKLIWYGPGKHWVMAVYDEFEKKQWIAFHTSTDLKNWTFQSRIAGYFECPEIFELPVAPASVPVDGKAENTRWVIYAADAKYAVGKFDGKTFVPEHEGKHQVHWGPFYASQTYNNVPAGTEAGATRRVQIGWGRIDTPGMAFNQMMAFPCELTLRTTDEGIRMFAKPIKEIEKLHKEKHAKEDVTLEAGKPLSVSVREDILEIQAEFAVGNAKSFGVEVGGTKIAYDVEKSSLMKMPLKPVDGKVRMQILVDISSIEVCGNDGRVYLTQAFNNPRKLGAISFFSEGGTTKVGKMEVFELKSGWEK
ncbi:MAG TPA: glycoside hydrolase family 32 protein [Planctomycetota bacterium]|jgi:fructan beta-fructosidase